MHQSGTAKVSKVVCFSYVMPSELRSGLHYWVFIEIADSGGADQNVLIDQNLLVELGTTVIICSTKS